MRTGSLFSGVGMLDVAVADVLGGKVAWHVETDPAASRVLAHHWPDVPNYGDITAVDWNRVEPVDVLTAGYPCQPFSNAGQRRGEADDRYLWPEVARTIRHLRPGLVVLENVAAHVVRGFPAVVGQLAALRYDAVWCCLRAADVGTPHGRARLFVLAHPADAASPRRRAVQGAAGWLNSAPAASDRAPEPGRRDRAAADAAGTGWIRSGLPRSDARASSRPAAGRDRAQLLPTPRATDGSKGGPGQRGSAGDLMLPSAVALLPTPTARDANASRNATANRSPDARPFDVGTTLTDAVDGSVDWSTYGPAIRRWGQILGRPAPAPTITGQRGGRKLNPALCEWMMGWPAGWVTAVPGISVNDQLRLCGNGVVPQQAAAALGWLLAADLDSRRSA